jgi:hypothetical protein
MATLRAALAEVFPALNSTNNTTMSEAIGRKDDTGYWVVSSTRSLMSYMKGLIPIINIIRAGTDKIDLVAVNGLAGVKDSLAYKVAEIEKHFHSSQQWWGWYINNIKRGELTAFQIVAGNSNYGIEKVMYTGTDIGGAYFDFNKLKVTAVGTANRLTFIEWYKTIKAAGIAATSQNTGDTITKNGHGLANGTKLLLTILTGSTGLDSSTVYYVVNQAANTFQVSLTLGGAAVVITVDGTLQYHTLTQTLITEEYISRTSTSPDTFTIPMQSPRVESTAGITVRAKAASGTNTIDVLVGLHTYDY